MIVSTKEFISNQEMYFDMAVKEDIFVQNGENMFMFTMANGRRKKYKKPDADFYRAITKDELLKGIYEDIDVFFANK